MFPYRDDNPTLATPIVTLLVIAVNVVIWVLVQGMGSEPNLSRSVCELGLIPGELLGRLPDGFSVPMSDSTVCVINGQQSWFTPLSSMFLHGGWFHLIGNMWFLWVFGNNVEDSMGHARFLVFYLLCGIAAAATQTLVNPASAVPMVGASGAISGVMGAYVVLYPRVRVHVLVILVVFITRIVVPAYLMLGYWFLLQLIGGGLARGEGGVAFWAHAGGFVAGALLIHVFRDPELVAKHRALSRTTEGLVYRER
ncbi:MAG TPA: rhomboid family intramembrane serine protease [Gemmatimonadales bacterium]|jgi:membrane associated rhomboid family serine protease|nr:rhomboid family intramembrane serine protease [Gemmatimonadales bacterium]